MASYPPPNPQAGPYSSYDRRTWRAQQKMQQRALKQQARMQRDQLRWQARAMRRSSIVGPLLVLALGVVLLLAQTGKISWPNTLAWYGNWWPLVLIGAGALLMLEWFVDQRMRGNDPARPVRTVGGGIIFLLVLLAIAGGASHAAQRGLEWKDAHYGRNFHIFDFAFGDRHDMDDTASSPIAAGGALLVRNPHGDVTVTGSSDDGQVHVSIHKQITATSDEDAEHKRQQMQPVFSGPGNNLVLDVPWQNGAQEDLVLQVPHNTVLTVQADRGSIDVQEVHAAVSVSAGGGEVNLSGINGAVSAHMNSRDSAFSAHSVTGPVSLEGHTGDINLSDITGPVDMHGEFFGTTHVERVNGPVGFRTNRTQFQVARVDGEIEIESGSDLHADSVMGPVTLQTKYRNITLDRVQGSVQIANRDGSVTVTNAPPLGEINITNQHGSVEVGLPEHAAFNVNAETHDGDIDNDFGLQSQGSHERPVLIGNIGTGGPLVKIQTTDGDVTVRKSVVEPLPPAPPAPPRITMSPASPAVPVTPATSKGLPVPKVQGAPKAPVGQKAAPSAPATPPKAAAPTPPTPPTP